MPGRGRERASEEKSHSVYDLPSMKKETYEAEYDRPDGIGLCRLVMIHLCSENQWLMAITLSLDSRCKKNMSGVHFNHGTI
jgi:hypothetical protein